MNTQRTLARIISLILTPATLLTLTFASHNLSAEPCDYYKEEITYYENLRRNGGNSDEMNRWTAIGHELDDKYRHCRQDNEVVIQTAAGEKSQPVYAPPTQAYKPLRRSSLKDDEQLQRLTKTCNYWIETTNDNPTQDNSNFRDTACRAVDNYENGQASNNSPSDKMPVRKLKDCIKPHNLVDHEVNECVRGNIDPYWQKK